MKKLFKIIFGIFGTLITLSLILSIVVIFLLYDDEKPNFTADTEYNTIPVEVGKDLKNSLNNISTTNYSDNYVELSLDVDTLNGFLVDIIRDSINEEYLISTDKIVSINSLSIDSIFFIGDGDYLGLKLRASAFGFFKTTFSISTTLTCDENMVLTASYKKFNLGNNISIDKSYVESILNSLGNEINGSVSAFNITSDSIEIDLRKFLSSSTSSSLIFDLISSADMSVKFSDSKVIIRFDTSKLFSDYSFDNPKTTNGIMSAVGEALLNPNADSSFTISLTEEQFNALIYDDVTVEINKLSKTYEIGDESFSISVIPDSVYYNIFSSKIGLGILFNNLEASAEVDITRTLEKNEEFITNIKIEVGGFKIGQYYVDSYSEHLSSFSISKDQIIASLNLGDTYNIKDIEFNEVSKIIKITII